MVLSVQGTGSKPVPNTHNMGVSGVFASFLDRCGPIWSKCL